MMMVMMMVMTVKNLAAYLIEIPASGAVDNCPGSSGAEGPLRVKIGMMVMLVVLMVLELPVKVVMMVVKIGMLDI